MSMSKYVLGFVNKEDYEKAVQARQILNKLHIDYDTKLDEVIEEGHEIPCIEGSTADYEYIDVDVKSLPKDIETLRFVISW